MSTMTLTCNAYAQPVGLVPMRDAVSRLACAHLDHDKAPYQTLVADEQRVFRSVCGLVIPAPLVVLNPHDDRDYVELSPKEKAKVSRRVLFARDRYTCQYCGFEATPGKALKQLTMDHVKPAHLFPTKSSATTWENVAAACRSCNNRKGGFLPMECGMMPRTTPRQPHFVQVRFAGRLNPAQRDYVADYFRLQERGGIVL